MKIGYKCLDMNMKLISVPMNFQYEMNKVYYMSEKELEKDGVGFYYFKELKDINKIYSLNTSHNRIFEVEVLGKEITNDTNDGIYCTNSIKFIREIYQEDINKYIEDNIKELVNDEDWRIRKLLAEKGFCLDKLIYDKEWIIRCEVANQGYGLDILINDKDWHVLKIISYKYHRYNIPIKIKIFIYKLINYFKEEK